ncbi:hypothetical protein B0H10DRAFT_1939629 [Mycena sp. CBHHK59/15]|nr:hypothetical protein B0H10DRAFT_1939629 [Mycena sp. CBHHK59/15]
MWALHLGNPVDLQFLYIILHASEGRAVGDTNGTGSTGYPSNTPGWYGVFELRSRPAHNDDEAARKTLQGGVQIQLEHVTHKQVDGVETVQEVLEDKYSTSGQIHERSVTNTRGIVAWINYHLIVAMLTKPYVNPSFHTSLLPPCLGRLAEHDIEDTLQPGICERD